MPDRHAAVHLLRLLRGGLPQGRHPHGHGDLRDQRLHPPGHDPRQGVHDRPDGRQEAPGRVLLPGAPGRGTSRLRPGGGPRAAGGRAPRPVIPARPVLVTGAGGLLGSALVRTGQVRGLRREELDITDRDAVARVLDTLRPAAVINAAAQARVDLAEVERAWTEAVNHHAVAALAEACRRRGIRLVHIGTDYSLRSDRDLTPDMPPDPRGHYAETKSRGERAALARGALVVRVQWVYHPGHPGFFTRSLQALRRGETVRLVTDQVGVPTPAALLAPALVIAARGEATGMVHLACQGHTTPWGWIEAAAASLGLPFSAEPITRADLGGAPRPARSVLNSDSFAAAFGLRLPHWKVALGEVLATAGAPAGEAGPATAPHR
ncbi:MAG: NAD-dependent epimerase/dehydratase family protein [Deltaproteobacteria bacterium]|nr:MAG: NAD-dependent epimerase/dehydratase family protein [Deltaproteobacteria bacterium]